MKFLQIWKEEYEVENETTKMIQIENGTQRNTKKKRIYKLFTLNRINQISELQSRRVSPRETSPAFVHRSNEGETSEVPKNARIDAISPSNI